MNAIRPRATLTHPSAPTEISAIPYVRLFPICLVFLIVAHALAFSANGSRSARASIRDALKQRSNFLQQGSMRLLPGKIQLQPCSQAISIAETKMECGTLSQFSVIDTAIAWTTRDTLRHLYSYDDHAKRTVDRVQRLAGDQWVDTMLQTNTYDTHGNMLTDTYEGLTPGCGAHRGMRLLYTYDTNDRLVAAVTQHQDTVEWRTIVRDTYTYDASGNLLTVLYQGYREVTGQWNDMSRDSYAYDAKGNKISWLSEYCTDGVWDGVSRSTYFYDALGRDSCRLEEQGYLNEWWVSSREWHTYGASGELLYDTHTNWRDSCWRDGFRYAYVYDGNHKLLSEQTEWWRDTVWFVEDRRTYSYDAAGRQSGWLSETCTDSQWVNETRWDYTYDAEGRVSCWTSAYWDTSGWNEGRAGIFSIVDSAKNEYWFHGAVWVMLRYMTIGAGVNTPDREVPGEFALFQNYPNPFNPKTVISSQLPVASYVELEVYDLLGREVAVLVNERRAAGSYRDIFDGSGLASGVYFYRLRAGHFLATKRLMLIQ